MDAGQFVTILSNVTAIISYIATAAAAIYVYLTFKQGRKSQQAQVFLDLSRRYNEINATRNKLLTMNFDWAHLRIKYSTSEDLVNSLDWITLRQVASCYELIGVLVKHEYIDEEVLFDTILVNPRFLAIAHCRIT